MGRLGRLLLVLITPLGPFVCDATLCRDSPHPRYDGYWQREAANGDGWLRPSGPTGTLFITVDHQPALIFRCERVAVSPKDEDLWRCQ